MYVSEPDKVEWIEITEYNEWEGETWHHFFIYSEDHYHILQDAVIKHKEDGAFSIRRTTLSWEAAENLTNLDDCSYMQEYWFGELTNPEGLIETGNIYKGKLRDYGEELFSYEED